MKTKKEEFVKPSVTATVVFAEKNFYDAKTRFLFIKRKNEPFAGHYALPGGFLEVANQETLKECACREFYEETSYRIYPHELKLLNISDEPNRDPRDRVIDMVYLCYIDRSLSDKPKDKKLKNNDEVSELKYLTLEEVFKENIAFDHKSNILKAYSFIFTDTIFSINKSM